MARMRKPDDTVSPARRSVHALGVALQVAGGLGFLAGLLGFAAGIGAVRSGGSVGNPFAWWFAAVIGMVLLVAGGVLRHVGARGIAGSGLVLDPKQARRDLAPWARTGGGLLKDAVEEAGLSDRSA